MPKVPHTKRPLGQPVNPIRNFESRISPDPYVRLFWGGEPDLIEPIERDDPTSPHVASIRSPGLRLKLTEPPFFEPKVGYKTVQGGETALTC